MKTQNTLENKAKFFAHYLNQQVFYQDRIGNIVSFYLSCGNFTKQVWIVSLEDENFEKNELSCNANINECQLILKPLSQISDEDAIHGLKLIISSRNSSAFDYCKSQNYSIEQMVNYFNRHLVYDFKLILTDYLRSKGYVLPYMDLSVEDLVEYGWVKLKEN